MTPHTHRLVFAAIATLWLSPALLPAQGYVAMTATQVPQTNAPLGVADAGIAARADGSWVVFGGEQSSGLLATTYVVNNNVWQPRISLFNPALRTGHQLAFDGARGDSVMFGGKDVLGNALSDTWVFANDQWSYRPTPSPSARSSHRMCFDAARGVVVLFGGKDAAQTLLGDTWTWNGTAWAQVATAVAPAARHEHGVAYDAYRQKVVLFGGEDASGLRSDVWDWDGTSWVEVVPPLVNGVPFGPVARKQHAMGFDAVAERVVVFGGATVLGGPSNEAWAFDGLNWVGMSGPLPSARAKVGLALSANDRVCVFGGLGLQGVLGDFWEVPVPFLPSASVYGAPCVGSGGPLRLNSVTGAQCALGASFAMELSGLGSPSSLGVGFVGLSRDSIVGVPLPLDLGTLGIPGCYAYNSADLSFPLGLPSGTPAVTSWGVLVPNDVYFLGFDLYFQCLVLELPGFARFATVSNGLAASIGYQLSPRPPYPDARLNMLLVSAGTYSMGSSMIGGVSSPVHSVALLREFWIGKYEVTQAEFQAVMGRNPSYFQGTFPNAPSRPVERVTWSDAVAYCANLNLTESLAGRVPPGYQYRLPTEAEWEYCCRAGTVTEWNTGASLLCGQANVQGCLIPQNSSVGSFPSNAWGLQDTHGNVWEWCLDAWDGTPNYGASPVVNPYTTVGQQRVIRGGSWIFAPSWARSAVRVAVAPGVAANDIGFRVVLAPILVP